MILAFHITLNNTVCDNYTYKHDCNKENIKSTFSSKYVSSLSSVLMTFFLKRNPVYLLEMMLMSLKYMKVFLISY